MTESIKGRNWADRAGTPISLVAGGHLFGHDRDMGDGASARLTEDARHVPVAQGLRTGEDEVDVERLWRQQRFNADTGDVSRVNEADPLIVG